LQLFVSGSSDTQRAPHHAVVQTSSMSANAHIGVVVVSLSSMCGSGVRSRLLCLPAETLLA